MTPERFREAEAIFQAACALPAAERTAFAERSCPNDPELLAQVRRLLANDRRPAEDFRSPAARAVREIADAMLDPAAAPRGLPERIGSYRVIKLLGEGGFGTVYLAEQQHPRREVAVKVLRASLASPSLLRRFEYEAQVLGRLQHAGIAQIYEAGTAVDQDGAQAFLAMEFVPGRPLDEYAATRGLDARSRLELVARICDAVQYAHQKGVIHRDLKPANILVMDDREQKGTDSRISHHSPLTSHHSRDRQVACRTPKILDFGVARMSDPDARTITLATGHGQLIGTLPYMSPEQAAGDPDAIDTRSDVYALGVVLYQLLTGRLPHAVGDCSMLEAAQRIRDESPPRLSSIDRSMRGDVEVIVQKALEKDKTRRYQSAAELAGDIRRHLAGEPIEAKRDSTWYVFKKTVKRHRVPVAGGLIIALLLVASTVISWRLRQRAEDALYDSLLAQARATRRTGQQGQRFDALAAIRRAAEIRPSLELRNEAIAAVTLTDIRPMETAISRRGSVITRYDRNLERCVVAQDDSSAEIVRISDDAELASIPPVLPRPRNCYHSLFNRYYVRSYWDGPEKRWLELWRLPPGAWSAEVRDDAAAGGDGAIQAPERVLRLDSLPYQAYFDVTPDERRLAVSLNDSAIHLLDLGTYQEVKRLELDSDPRYIKFDPEGRQIIVFHGDFAAKACIVDVETGERTRVFEGANIQWSVAWSPDGSRLAGADGWSVQFWDAKARRPLGRMPTVHNQAVTTACFAPGGDLLLTKAWDGAPVIWDARLFEPRLRVHGRFWDSGPSTMSADGRRLAGVDSDDGWNWRPALYELESGTEFFSLVPRSTQSAAGGTSALTYGEFTSDGSLLFFFATSEHDPVSGLYVFDVASRRELAWIPTEGFGDVSLDPDERFAVVCCGSGPWRWPIARDAEAIRLGPPERIRGASHVAQAELSRDGQAALLRGFGPSEVLRLDLNGNDEAVSVEKGEFRMTWDLSSDGRFLATYRENFGMVIRDPRTLATVHEIPGNHRPLAFSADNRWLATTDYRQVCLWEVGAWRQVSCIPVSVDRLAFSPDGRLLATRSGMTQIRLWRTDTMAEVATLESPGMSPHSFVFSPDSTMLAAFMARNLTTCVWDLRNIRRHLGELGLDWDLPPYPPAEAPAMPLRIEIDWGTEWPTKNE